ncbi:hypothetical protein CMQ_5472 [Grosmannia clavigera kw1407]|uniref:Uncharacterized protein n=1 Tax=Grosmannia clavigera (strain kw1407 / UAMH 11150) TaxID=655863 RepID=F0XRN3_GROCL|nr:uncharacterized protein CMQ_5472 [Grosmannia clavigera kw1407]EFW99661.1 hypothetical protein CMQ_5472 [Grosmannia clavigera kw1407]
MQDDFDRADVAMNEDDTPDNLTVASVSYAAEDDYDMSNFSAPQRKRKREDMIQDMTEQQHSVYGDELLDYFLLSRNEQPAIRPDPPTNFQPNWVIDTERHTALHWACAMGDVEVIKQLKRFGASLGVQNERGETPFMRAVSFTNCFEKQTFPAIIKELFETVDARDKAGCTIIHHAAIMKSGRVTSQSCARYYLDNILNRLQDTHDPNFVQQLIDAQDNEGNTAVHLAAMKHATKCIRALLGRGASTDIPNHSGLRAEDMIKELNANKKSRAPPQRSSSPFAPDSQRRFAFRDTVADLQRKTGAPYQSEAANTVQSRITPLVFEKFKDLSQSYEEEFRDKAEAEREAERILGSTQGELLAMRAEMADLEIRMEPDEIAADFAEDAKLSQKQLISLVGQRNRILAQSDVDSELAGLVGDGQGITGAGDVVDEHQQLAIELRQHIIEQHQAEGDYVDALAAVGTSDNIEKYRRLLRSCLGPEADSLEENLEGMIAMMEEEVSDGIRHASREPMEIVAI